MADDMENKEMQPEDVQVEETQKNKLEQTKEILEALDTRDNQRRWLEAQSKDTRSPQNRTNAEELRQQIKEKLGQPENKNDLNAQRRVLDEMKEVFGDKLSPLIEDVWKEEKEKTLDDLNQERKQNGKEGDLTVEDMENGEDKTSMMEKAAQKSDDIEMAEDSKIRDGKLDEKQVEMREADKAKDDNKVTLAALKAKQAQRG